MQKEYLSEIVKKLRAKKGISQRELAQISGFHINTICDMENSKKHKKIKYENYQKVIKSLGSEMVIIVLG